MYSFSTCIPTRDRSKSPRRHSAQGDEIIHSGTVVDELGIVGYGEDMDLQQLYEKSG